MKLLRAIAVLVGLADLSFAFLFLARAGGMVGAAEAPEYARWLGACLLASAATLFLLASDAERYLPLAFINAGARALAAIVGLPALARQIGTVISHGALAAILIIVIVYELRKKRDEASSGEPPNPVLRRVPKGPAPQEPKGAAPKQP